MSTCEFQEERLQDHAEGLLDEAAARAVEAHVEGCDGCAGTLEGLRALLRGAQALPRDLQPPRDLWPGIARGLSGSRRRSRLVWRVAVPALAAGLLMVLTAWVTLRIARPEASNDRRPVALPEVALAGLESFRGAEVEYRRVTDDLLALLEERRDELAPETVAVVEENLRIINRAITDAWAALEKDPARVESGHLMTSLYRRKVEILQRAVDLSAAS